MPNAIERLLADHKMIRKTLDTYDLDSPRFRIMRETLHRIVLGHAWFEDVMLLPALQREPYLIKTFVEEIAQEHRDIGSLLKLIATTSADRRKEIESYIFQLRVILDTHFKKEEDGLFPMAERILKSEGLLELGQQMEKRKTEVRAVADEASRIEAQT